MSSSKWMKLLDVGRIMNLPAYSDKVNATPFTPLKGLGFPFWERVN